MSIKAYCAYVIVNIKPIYLNKNVFFRVFLQLKENYNQKKYSLKVKLKKVWIVK